MCPGSREQRLRTWGAVLAWGPLARDPHTVLAAGPRRPSEQAAVRVPGRRRDASSGGAPARTGCGGRSASYAAIRS